MGSKPENVAVYGGDHSPWVQAVLLALYDKDIFHSVATMPSPKLFVQSGILMPAVRFDGGGWEMESQEILCKLGYERLSDDDMLAIYRALRGGCTESIVSDNFGGLGVLSGIFVCHSFFA